MKHWPYFLGEFDGDGNLVDEKDPFLYWYLPILKVPTRYPDHEQKVGGMGAPAIRARDIAPRDGFLLDGLELHAAGRPRRPLEENK